MPLKTYTSAIELTEDTWKYASRKEKIKLLKSLGYDGSWAKAKSLPELVARGGGMVANSLKNLSLEYLKRNGGSVTINREY